MAEDAERFKLLNDEEVKRDLEKNQQRKSYIDVTKGMAAAFLNVLLNVASAVCVQLLERDIPDFQLNTIRYGIPVLFVMVIILWTKQWPLVPKPDIIGVACFGLSGFIMSLGVFVSISFLPASTVHCMVVTTNILFGVAMFAVCLKEKITLPNVIAIILAVIGVIMVIQPNHVFKTIRTEESSIQVINRCPKGNNQTSNISATVKDTNQSSFILGTGTNLTTGNHSKFNLSMDNSTHPMTINDSSCIYENNIDNQPSLISSIFILTLPIIGGAAMACDVLIVKMKTYLMENISSVLFWTFSGNLLFSVILMFTLETPVIPKDWWDTFLALFHGITNGLMWPVYMYALKFISGNTFNMIYSTTTVFLLVAQYTVLSSILPGHRNWIEVLGVVLVTLGSGLSSFLEIKNTQTDLE